jgi:hypothetical protein
MSKPLAFKRPDPGPVEIRLGARISDAVYAQLISHRHWILVRGGHIRAVELHPDVVPITFSGGGLGSDRLRPGDRLYPLNLAALGEGLEVTA